MALHFFTDADTIIICALLKVSYYYRFVTITRGIRLNLNFKPMYHSCLHLY